MFFDLTNDLLKSGYAIRFRAPGHSMHPTIRDRETVTVEPVNWRDVRRGDIVLYQHAQRLIAHRVVKVGNENFLVRGDASRITDGPVDATLILGRVVSVERDGRARRLRGRRDSLTRALYRLAVRVKHRRSRNSSAIPNEVSTARGSGWAI